MALAELPEDGLCLKAFPDTGGMEPRQPSLGIARGAAPGRETFPDAAPEGDGARELPVEQATQRRQRGGGTQEGTVGEGCARHAPRSPCGASPVNAGPCCARTEIC